MNFDESLQYLLGLGHETLAIKLGLRNTELLLDALQNPELSFTSVQIAGTNGKGSTAAFLDSICRVGGISIGLYTSPHLESITERIVIKGKNISTEDFARHATVIREAATRLVTQGAIEALPTFFEQLTAIALTAFREARVELAILETGLGGRLDSTTAVKAQICAITQIALDHQEYLGTDLKSIAAEKAAIIRQGSSVVIAPQEPEALETIRRQCKQVGVTPVVADKPSKIIDVSTDGRFQVTFESRESSYENCWLGLRGHHQIENAAVAIELAEFLREKGFQISGTALKEGLQETRHAGRLELISSKPVILLDGAHNPAGAEMLRKYLDEFGKRPLTIVFGAMRDKQVEEIARNLFPAADSIVVTQVNNPRSASVESMVQIAQSYVEDSLSTANSSTEAILLAQERTSPKGMICVTGSLYLIGEIRGQLIQYSKSNEN